MEIANKSIGICNDMIDEFMNKIPDLGKAPEGLAKSYFGTRQSMLPIF